MENWWKILVDIFCASFSLKCYLGICWWKVWEKMPYLVSLNPLVFKNIAYIGSWKHFVFVYVCVSFLYLSFCKSSSWSLSSPDGRLSENIWFVWSSISYSAVYKNGDVNRWDKQQRTTKIELLVVYTTNRVYSVDTDC